MRYSLEDAQCNSSLPEWMTEPDCPAWARDSRYIDIDAMTALEVRRGFIDQRTLNKRLYRRRHHAKQRAERPPSVPADRRLAKLKAHVTMWRNHIAKAEAHAPGSMEAAKAMFSIPSYRKHLVEAQAALSAHVESELRKELSRDE